MIKQPKSSRVRTMQFVVFVTSLLSFGCSPEDSAHKTVVSAIETMAAAPKTENAIVGKLTINRRFPMPAGLAVVYSEETDEPVSYAQIQTDGSFRIESAPAGEAILLVKKSLNEKSRDEGKKPPTQLNRRSAARTQPLEKETVKPGVPAWARLPKSYVIPSDRLSFETQQLPYLQWIMQEVYKKYGNLHDDDAMRMTVGEGENRVRFGH